MRSIKYLVDKIKWFLEIFDNHDFVVILTVILVGFASFGLGRISRIDESENLAQISDISKVCSGYSGSSGEVEGQVVASKTGAKYHFPWCSGAQTIAENNKVWFNSIEEAKNAGYEPAKNCKGLE